MKKTNRFKLFYTLYFIVNVVTLYQIYSLSPLPHKYNYLIGGLLVVIALAIYYGVFRSKKRFLNSMSKSLLILLSLVMIIGNLLLYKYGSFLGNIAGGLEKNDLISVVVRKDSPYEKLNDVADLTFGIEDENEEIVHEGIDNFNQQLNTNIATSEYKNYGELANALLSEQIEVIIINEAYRNFIEDDYSDFSENTKVIAQYKKTTQIKKPTLKVDEDVFTMMISGIDVYGAISNNSRSDVNIMAVINPKTKKILLVSIPRDYYLPMTCKNGAMDKLTHTGIYGIDCTMDTVGALFDVDIDYYTRVNFSSLVNVVDTIGGVTVYNDHPFSAGQYSFPVGENYLDGAKSLVFVRDRYHQVDGDLARGRNQVKVLTAIINKIASPALITNFNSILNSLEGSFQTNLSKDDISSLVRLQLNDPTAWDIIQEQVGGTGASDYSYALGGNYYMMYPDLAKVDVIKGIIAEISE